MPFSEQTVSVIIGAASSLGRVVEQALSTRPGQVVARLGSQLDITDEWAVGSFFESLGPIDHVVLTGRPATLVHRSAALDVAAAKAAFDIEFWGALGVAQEAARHLRPGGSITLTAVSPSQRSAAADIVLSATHAALAMATRVLAGELTPSRVNLVDASAPCHLVHGCLFAIDNPWVTGAVLPLRRSADDLRAAERLCHRRHLEHRRARAAAG